MVLRLSQITAGKKLKQDPNLKNLQIKTKKAGILGELGKKMIRKDEAIKHMSRDLSRGISKRGMIEVLRKKYGFESSKGREIVNNLEQKKESSINQKNIIKEFKKSTPLTEMQKESQKRPLSKHEQALLEKKEARHTAGILISRKTADFEEAIEVYKEEKGGLEQKPLMSGSQYGKQEERQAAIGQFGLRGQKSPTQTDKEMGVGLGKKEKYKGIADIRSKPASAPADTSETTPPPIPLSR